MRVIAGDAKGRRLSAPVTHAVRPATDRLKEALFNILYDVTDANVLDLFAGSGGLAIEALSRGASAATLVDDLEASVAAIRANIDHCGYAARTCVVRQDVNSFLAHAARGVPHGEIWNILFIDPPYDIESAYLERLAAELTVLDRQAGCLGVDTRIVFERATGSDSPPLPDGFGVTSARKYGQTMLYIASRSSD